MRRLQALNAAPFLVDHDGSVRPVDRLAEGGDKVADFRGFAAVALEQDQGKRLVRIE
jgi:hypothetical protein